MAQVTLYTTRYCPFCVRARYLLEQKSAAFPDLSVEEIPVDNNPDLRRQMMAKSGRHTVPQIWVGERHVGGCDELMALERSGELDQLLAATAP